MISAFFYNYHMCKNGKNWNTYNGRIGCEDGIVNKVGKTDFFYRCFAENGKKWNSNF